MHKPKVQRLPRGHSVAGLRPRAPARAAARRSPRGSSPRTPPIPWYLRRRVLYPATFLSFMCLTLAVLWWHTPVENPLTGERENLGTRLTRGMQSLVNPKQSLSVAFPGRRQISVLLVGLDEVPSSRVDPDPPHRADSVLAGAVDFETKQIRVVSIPRDGWVLHTKDGGQRIGHDKLAHTYVYGGIERTEDTVESLLGFALDFYVVVQFEGLERLVDALGGLTVDVEKDMSYDDERGNVHIHLRQGTRHLSGAEVVQYARFRHDALGDIGRMQRQQKVIRLVLEELMAARNLPKLPTLAQIAYESVKTNLSLDQLLALAQHMDEYSPDCIQTQTLPSFWNREPGKEIELPGVPEGQVVDAQFIYARDIAEARRFLTDLAPPPPPEPEPEPQLAVAPEQPAES